MSKLSLCEIQQSQLDKTPIVDGQLVCCLDTGNTYRDTAGGRVRIGSDLERVSELPLAPLAGKIYYLPPGAATLPKVRQRFRSAGRSAVRSAS